MHNYTIRMQHQHLISHRIAIHGFEESQLVITQYEPNKIELNIEMDPIYHKLSVLTQSANIIYYDAHIFIYAVRSEKNLERWKAKNRKSVNLHFHATTQLTNNRRKCLPII